MPSIVFSCRSTAVNVNGSYYAFYNLSAWASGTFVAGQCCSTGGNAYECIVGGSSTAAPTGTQNIIVTTGGAIFAWMAPATYNSSTALNDWANAMHTAYTGSGWPFNIAVFVWSGGIVISAAINSISVLSLFSIADNGFTTVITTYPGQSFRDKGPGLPLAYTPANGVAFDIAAGSENSGGQYIFTNINSFTVKGIQFRDANTPNAAGPTILANASGNSTIYRDCLFDCYQPFYTGTNNSGLVDCVCVIRGNAPLTGSFPIRWDTGATGAIIEGCTVVATGTGNGPGSLVVHLNSTPGTGIARNNIFMGGVTPLMNQNAQGVWVADHNVFSCTQDAETIHTVNGFPINDLGTNIYSQTAAALFWSSTTDFRLNAGAVAIGAGVVDTTDNPLGDDIFGQVRGATWDIGAAQFNPAFNNAVAVMAVLPPQARLSALAFIPQLAQAQGSLPSGPPPIEGGTFTDPTGVVWGISPTNVITYNGVPDTSTSNVIEVILMPGPPQVAWQLNSLGNWYFQNIPAVPFGWTLGGTTSPLISPGFVIPGLTPAMSYNVAATVSNAQYLLNGIVNGGTSDLSNVVSAATTMGGGAGGSLTFSVRNGQIIDQTGRSFVAKGVAMTDASMVPASTLIATWPGLNIVNFALGSEVGGLPGGYQAAIPVSQILAWTADATSRGLIVILSDYYAGTPSGQPPPRTGQDLINMANWYASLAGPTASNGRVWWTTSNEAAAATQTGMGESWQATYNAIRGAGNNGMIFFESAYGSFPHTFGSDPSVPPNCFNVGYNVHPYPGALNGATDLASAIAQHQSQIALWNNFARSQDGVMPVLAGEYGPSSNGSDIDDVFVNGQFLDVQTVDALATNTAGGFCGYTAWVVSYNNGGYNGGDALLQPNTLNSPVLTQYGQQIANEIAAAPGGSLGGTSGGGGQGSNLTQDQINTVMAAINTTQQAEVPGGELFGNPPVPYKMQEALVGDVIITQAPNLQESGVQGSYTDRDGNVWSLIAGQPFQTNPEDWWWGGILLNGAVIPGVEPGGADGYGGYFIALRYRASDGSVWVEEAKGSGWWNLTVAQENPGDFASFARPGLGPDPGH